MKILDSRYESPTISPSGFIAMPSAAGTFGSPGMVMMSPVFATTFGNPTFAAHDSQGASQTGAIHRQHFTQLAMRDFTSSRKYLQDCELSSA